MKTLSDNPLSMRILAIIVAVVSLAVSTSTGSAGNSRSELERAIAKLADRKGPPSAYSDADEQSLLLPPGLIQRSLWQRLKSRFEFVGLEHPDIDAQIEYFRAGIPSLRANLARAEPFLFFIAEELDRAGLPLDLIVLPLVESAYNPHARSKRSAVGIWQFIPSTAKIFGLPVTQDYDGRKDIVTSTRAAIKYLSKLHKSFGGDWLLAMAAYNTGPSNVRSALNRAVKNGETPDFWHLKLAKETRDYVPRILAAARIISFPEKYGLKLPDVANHKAIDIVSVGRPITFAQVARVTKHSIEKIALLNPGHSARAIPFGGPYHITVPTEYSDRLSAAIREDKLGPVEPDEPGDGVPVAIPGNEARYLVVPDAYLPEATTPVPFKPYKKYVYQSHVVAQGENLWKIAREMNTDVATLQRWNGRSEKPLQPGDKLIAAYMQEESSTDTKPRMLSYRVHSSDTLISISDKFDVKISDLKKWNPSLWKKNQVLGGQLIHIPVAVSSDL